MRRFLFAFLALTLGCSAPALDDDRSPRREDDPSLPGPRTPSGSNKPDGGTDPAAPTPSPTGTTSSAIDVDLGVITPGATVEIEVPPNVLGFNVTVSSEGAGTVGIEKIVSPSGAAIVDGFKTKKSISRWSEGHDGMGCASVPLNDLAESAPVPGKWKITFAGAGTNAHARVRMQKTADGAFHGGALDVHFHLPVGLKLFKAGTSHVVDAAAAPNDPDLKARVDAFFFALDKTLGIDRGNVSYHDTEARFANIDDDPTYYASIATVSKAFPVEHAVHVLLTNDLYDGQWTGYAPNVPAAATETGTPMSAVTLALYDGSTPSWDGFTLLHEIGHFVGMQHTTEADGQEVDLFDDTPTCGGKVPSLECADETNFMSTFWPDDPPLRVVSASQRKIFQSSPIYRAFQSRAEQLANDKTNANRGRSYEDMLAFTSTTTTGAVKGKSSGRFCGHSRQMHH